MKSSFCRFLGVPFEFAYSDSLNALHKVHVWWSFMSPCDFSPLFSFSPYKYRVLALIKCINDNEMMVFDSYNLIYLSSEIIMLNDNY